MVTTEVTYASGGGAVFLDGGTEVNMPTSEYVKNKRAVKGV